MNTLETEVFVSGIVLYIIAISYCAYKLSYQRKVEQSHPEYVEVWLYYLLPNVYPFPGNFSLSYLITGGGGT